MTECGGRANIKVWGEPEDNRVVIYVDKLAYDAIYRHGRANPDREVVGILMGTATEDSTGKYRVDIVGVVKSEAAPGNKVQAQFTHEVWLELVGLAQRQYPNQKVVGWYHTHPGFGAFLSEDDIVSHKVAFSHPWHVAAVCDPINGELCFFGWDGPELKAIKGFYTYEGPTKKREPLTMPKSPVPSPRPRFSLVAPLFVLTVAFFAIVGYIVGRHASGSQNQIARLGFEGQPATVASLFHQGQFYLYSIYGDGTVKRLTWKLVAPIRPEFKEEAKLPITPGKIERQVVDTSTQSFDSIGRLEVCVSTEGVTKTYIADISKNGSLTPWKLKPNIVVSPNYLLFGSNTNHVELNLTFADKSNASWSILSKPVWVKISGGGGKNIQEKEQQSGNATLKVTVDHSALRAGNYPDNIGIGKIAIKYDNERPLEIFVVVKIARLTEEGTTFQITGVKDNDGDGKIPKQGETIFVNVINKGNTEGKARVSVNPVENINWIIEGDSWAEQIIPPGEVREFAFKLKPNKSGPQPLKVTVTNMKDEHAYSAEFKQP